MSKRGVVGGEMDGLSFDAFSEGHFDDMVLDEDTRSNHPVPLEYSLLKGICISAAAT